MVKRKIVETVKEFDENELLKKETTTEMVEDDDTAYIPYYHSYPLLPPPQCGCSERKPPIQRVGEFEKVSYGQYHNAIKGLFPFGADECIKYTYENLLLPSRATSGSAGYDFKAPFAFSLAPDQSIKIPTGIRVKIDEGWWLGCLPRSGLGFKYRVQLDNTIAVIDSDYFYSDNEGHIFAKITNDSKEGKAVNIEMSDSFMQAIFIPYGITYSDACESVRNGGMGSTGV